jgi:hypothetical protein
MVAGRLPKCASGTIGRRDKPGDHSSMLFKLTRSRSFEDLPPTSGKVEAIGVHHLVPRGREVTHELLLCVAGAIDFGERPELRI